MPRHLILGLASICSFAACSSKSADKTEPAPSISEKAASAAASPNDGKNAYAEHMRAADALETKLQWADALRELEAALASQPNDPKALTEIGWAAYNAGNLARAKEASEAAATLATEPGLRGAALFNLGLAIAKEDPYASVSLMFAGYTLRPNATVASRLSETEHAVNANTQKCVNSKGKYKCAPAATNAGKAMLARVHVDELPAPAPPIEFHDPIDDALVVPLTKLGATFVGIGMMKAQLTVSELTCTVSKKTTPPSFECTARMVDANTMELAGDKKVGGDVARGLVANLDQRKVAARPAGDHVVYDASVNCRQYDDVYQGTDVACDVAALKP
jgi:hypothetical protein